MLRVYGGRAFELRFPNGWTVFVTVPISVLPVFEEGGEGVTESPRVQITAWNHKGETMEFYGGEAMDLPTEALLFFLECVNRLPPYFSGTQAAEVYYRSIQGQG
jgi:hypothetical protein